MSSFIDLDGPAPVVEEADLEPIATLPEKPKTPEAVETRQHEPVAESDPEDARRAMIQKVRLHRRI